LTGDQWSPLHWKVPGRDRRGVPGDDGDCHGRKCPRNDRKYDGDCHTSVRTGSQ